MTAAGTVHALTHTGARRAANEDALAVDDWICANDMSRPKALALAADTSHAVFVADGMGGHPGGDVASHTVVRFCAERGRAVTGGEDGERLITDVNAHLYAAMAKGQGPPGMGTTLAGAILIPEAVVLLNVGDSKIYRFDPQYGLVQLSVDDTPGPKLADGRTAAHTTPILDQTLGGQMHETPVTPHADVETPAAGARYLLCTDGLTDLVGPDRLAEMLAEKDDAAAVSAMFEAAMMEGGKDNITIALLTLD